MFKRREPLHLYRQLREMIWPSMGWKRTLSYIHHRLFRQSDSTYRIAGGLATGAAVSFTPFLGTHYIQCLIYAHLSRQSKLAALVGTFWGNPWTLPPMFYLDYKLGVWLLQMSGAEEQIALPHEHTMSFFLSEPMALLLPTSIGGIILGLLSWPVYYLILYYPVRRLQETYYNRRRLKLNLKMPWGHGGPE